MRLSLRRRNLLRSSALAALLMSGVAGAASAADPTYQFNIPAEPLSQALTDFSQASSQQIIFSEGLVRNRRSAGLRGTYTTAQALSALLADTDLKVETNSAGVLMVQSKNVQAASNEAAPTTGSIETVTVTGTHIRDVEALTPVTTITSVDMKTQGYTTLSQAIEQMPQNFKGGASAESNPLAHYGGSYNYTYATGVDLRGLGGNDTLVLLNGRRLPPTAFGEQTDISGIPASAIDRVEILDDGASAIYGSDAVAGVVNIITKTDFNGAELGLQADGISNGKDPNYGGYLLGGYNWDSGGFVGSYAYERQSPLLASARSFAKGVADPNQTDLLPDGKTSSFFGSLNQQLLPNLRLQVDAIYSDRRFMSSVNDISDGLIIANGTTKQFNGSAELDYAAFSDWTFSLIGQLANETDLVDSNDITRGSRLTGPVKYRVSSGEIRGSGSLFSLPAGSVRLAVGASERRDEYDQNQSACNIASGSCAPYIVQNANNNVFSAYAELFVPLVSRDNAIPFIQELRVDAAVRYDRYSSFGSTTNPKVALQWVPVDGLSLHGTYATSFKAPTLYDTTPSPVYGYIYSANPYDPSAPNALEYYASTNPDLKPETAVTYNAGLTYSPGFMPGLTLSGSYFNIAYRNRIEQLANTFSFGNLLNGQLGNFLVASPTSQQINNVISATASSGGSFDCYASDCSLSSIKYLANLGLENAAVVQIQGIDLDPKYEWDSGIGHFAFDADGSYFIQYDQKVTPEASSSTGTGIIYNPARFRAKLNLAWNMGGLSANLRGNFTSGERNTYDPHCSGGCHVASWTTFDASVGYSIGDVPDARFLNNSQLRVSVMNIFDRQPPYAYSLLGVNYDGLNANALGRAVTISLVKDL